MATDKRKPGKPRAWSARRAKALMYAEQRRAFNDHFEGDEGSPGADAIDERHLAKAYLCGYAAALNSDGSTTSYASEWMRLGMSPKPTGKGKGGKRKSGEGRT